MPLRNWRLRSRRPASAEEVREAYRERFTSPDDNLHALLEDALSMAAQKSARREAMQNALKASGKSVAEFAEMYGLDPIEAKRLLA